MNESSRSTVLVAWTVLLASSVSLSCTPCRPRNETALALTLVPVSVERAAGLEVDPKSAAGERQEVSGQAYTIGTDGRFTLHRDLKVEIGHLGVTLRDLDEDTAGELLLEAYSGVLVRRVVDEGPASTAGLQDGDIITAFDGTEVRSADQLRHLIRQTAPGTRVTLTIHDRDVNSSTVEAVIGSSSRLQRSIAFETELAQLDDRRRSGLRLVELTAALRPLVIGPDAADGGLLVAAIEPGGPAFYSELRARDHVTHVAGRSVASIGDYRAALEGLPPGERVSITARRGEAVVETTLRLAENALQEGSFDILLADHHGGPGRTEFNLLKGLLFSYRGCRSILHENSTFEHVSESQWGLLLNLLHYSGSPSRKRLVIAWLIPLTFESSS